MMADIKLKRGDKMARKKKKRFHLFRFLFEVLVLIILAAGLFIAFKFTKLTKGELDEDNLVKNESIAGDELDRMNRYKDIALFGIDSREGALESGANSDTIMICSINKETKEIKLVSVYRDSYLDTTEGEYRKCTEVYSIGGAQQAISMLNKNLDLNITDYVTVNFQAVVKIVDLFGGIDMNLTEGEAQWINNYLVEGREVLGMECDDVPGPGMQHLNGMQALAYSRIRAIGLDYERTERQRKVVEQLFNKMRSTSIFDLNTMIDTVLPLVSTSLSTVEILSLVPGIGSYKMGETQGFPFEKTTAVLSAGDCVIPVNLAQNVSELHGFLYGTNGYVPSAVVQQISGEIADATGVY